MLLITGGELILKQEVVEIILVKLEFLLLEDLAQEYWLIES